MMIPRPRHGSPPIDEFVLPRGEASPARALCAAADRVRPGCRFSTSKALLLRGGTGLLTCADLIKRDFSCSTSDINTRWCGDIAYSHTWEGWLYLATVIDLGSSRVVGWATADHLRTDLIAEALNNAVAQRRPEPGVIFHSDRGCQYTSAQFGALADEHGVRLSVGRQGQCWDNAVAESFFATIKTELIDRRGWPTRVAAHKAIFGYIEGWYNTRRLRSSLGYLSPNTYEATHRVA